jgi:hypothetical protein
MLHKILEDATFSGTLHSLLEHVLLLWNKFPPNSLLCLISELLPWWLQGSGNTGYRSQFCFCISESSSAFIHWQHYCRLANCGIDPPLRKVICEIEFFLLFMPFESNFLKLDIENHLYDTSICLFIAQVQSS